MVNKWYVLYQLSKEILNRGHDECIDEYSTGWFLTYNLLSQELAYNGKEITSYKEISSMIDNFHDMIPKKDSIFEDGEKDAKDFLKKIIKNKEKCVCL